MFSASCRFINIFWVFSISYEMFDAEDVVDGSYGGSVVLWIFSRYSGLPPQSKAMDIRLTGETELPLVE